MTKISLEEAAVLMHKEGHSLSSMFALFVSLLSAEKSEVYMVLEDESSTRGERLLAFAVLEKSPASTPNMKMIIEILKSKF